MRASPFSFNERVVFHPSAPDFRGKDGDLGEVLGMALDEDKDLWVYSVLLDRTEEVIFAREFELQTSSVPGPTSSHLTPSVVRVSKQGQLLGEARRKHKRRPS